MFRRASSLVLAFSLLACSSDGGDSKDTPPPASSSETQCTRQYASSTTKSECASPLSFAESALPESFRTHVQESTAVGTAVSRFVVDVEEAIILCVVDLYARALFGDTQPTTCDTYYKSSLTAGYSNGAYTVGASDDVRFFDHPVAATDASATIEFYRGADLVTADVRKPDSYLQGLKVGMQNGKAVITFDAPGPLAGVLGFGENPKSPIVVSMDDEAKIRAGFSAIAVEGELDAKLTDCQVTSTIVQTLPRTPVSDVVKNGIHATLTKGEATSGAAHLGVQTWELAYSGSGPTGSVTFGVTGSPVGSGKIAFASQPAYTSELTMTCAR